MIDPPGAAEGRVFVLERIVAVRVGGDDPVGMAPDADRESVRFRASLDLRFPGAALTAATEGVDGKPPELTVAFIGLAAMPASIQMMMMRYWLTHHRPTQLTLLRASPQAAPDAVMRATPGACDVVPHGSER